MEYKWQKRGQEEWAILKALCRNLLRSEGAQVYCGYAEPPGHIAEQNGNTVTPKERAQLAAKVLKTIPAHCASVEVVQEHDAKQCADRCKIA